MINTGSLNRRVLVVAPGTKTANGIGGYTETEGTSKTVWAAVNSIYNRQAEALSAGLVENTQMFEFVFRYYTVRDLTLQHTIEYKGKTFRIVRIYDPKESNDILKVIAYVRGN